MDWQDTASCKARSRGWSGASGPGRSGLRRMGLEVVRVRQDGGDGRGHEGGMQERLQGAWPLGVDRVEAVHRPVVVQ